MNLGLLPKDRENCGNLEHSEPLQGLVSGSPASPPHPQDVSWEYTLPVPILWLPGCMHVTAVYRYAHHHLFDFFFFFKDLSLPTF